MLRHALLCWTILAAFLAAKNAHAQVSDYQVKAGLLANFGLFVDWPDSALERADGAFRVCYLAPEAFDSAATPLEGKIVKGRPLNSKPVRFFKDVSSCHILFLGDPARTDTARWIEIAHQNQVLSVSDGTVAGTIQPIMTLSTEKNKVGFSIDLDAARDSRLVISSRLLQLARTVRGMH
jgi:YfiR/HmsC-like